MKRKAGISHDEATIRELRDNPEFAAECLRAALEDDDEPSVLLIALRRIAEARGGIAKVAKAAGIERESLYRVLSARGNPRLSTLFGVTKAVGLKLTVETSKQSVRRPFAIAHEDSGCLSGSIATMSLSFWMNWKVRRTGNRTLRLAVPSKNCRRSSASG